MAIIIDIIIVAIMLVCIFLGYKKGLIGAAVSIMGFFIALLIALVLYNPISNFIMNNTPIASTLQESITDTVTTYVIGSEDEKEDKSNKENEDNSPKVMTEYINDFIEKEKEKAEQTEREIIENVSETVTINLVKIAVVIVVFIIAKIGLLFVKALAKVISNIPIIGQFNKLGGVVYGVLQGLIIVYILLAIVSLFAPTMENTAIIEAINSSTIGKMMYDNNIILKIVF